MPPSSTVRVLLVEVDGRQQRLLAGDGEVGRRRGGEAVQGEQRRGRPPGTPRRACPATSPRGRSSTTAPGVELVETRLGVRRLRHDRLSSSSEVVDEPTVFSTPITVKVEPLMVTVWPIGLPRGEQLLGRRGPEHDDGRGAVQLGLGEEPALGDRPRPHRQPARRRADDARRPVGAAVDQRGLRARDRRDGGDVRRRRPGRRAPSRRARSASRPSRGRRGCRSSWSSCPGETISRLLPSELIWSLTWAEAPWPSPTVSMTAAMPIRMPSMVRADRIRRVRIASSAVRAGLGPVHRLHRRGQLGSSIWPSRIRIDPAGLRRRRRPRG